jgi:hypothetical protein
MCLLVTLFMRSTLSEWVPFMTLFCSGNSKQSRSEIWHIGWVFHCCDLLLGSLFTGGFVLLFQGHIATPHDLSPVIILFIQSGNFPSLITVSDFGFYGVGSTTFQIIIHVFYTIQKSFVPLRYTNCFTTRNSCQHTVIFDSGFVGVTPGWWWSPCGTPCGDTFPWFLGALQWLRWTTRAWKRQ